jgi:hypothetical protein
VDIADVGLVEHSGPAGFFMNGIDHVHRMYLYGPGPAFELAGDLLRRGQASGIRDEWRTGQLEWPAEVADRLIISGCKDPLALQTHSVGGKRPMTCQDLVWAQGPALRAAKTRSVVIGMDWMGTNGLAQRLARPLGKMPEFCESFEHRSPPFPRSAAGR